MFDFWQRRDKQTSNVYTFRRNPDRKQTSYTMSCNLKKVLSSFYPYVRLGILMVNGGHNNRVFMDVIKLKKIWVCVCWGCWHRVAPLSTTPHCLPSTQTCFQHLTNYKMRLQRFCYSKEHLKLAIMVNLSEVTVDVGVPWCSTFSEHIYYASLWTSFKKKKKTSIQL